MQTNLHLLFIVVLFSACKNNSDKDSYSDIASFNSVHEDGYVGDAQCMQCHTTTYDSWKNSDHDLAMQVANDSTVLGDFNDVKITLDGVSYFFTKKEKIFTVHIKEIDGSEKEYAIGYTLEITTTEQYTPIFNALKDASPLVRYYALTKFRGLNPADRISIAAEHISDTSRLVRIGVAEILNGLPSDQLQNLDQNALKKAQDELKTMLYTNADFSIGRMNLGDHFIQNNDIQNAIKQYQIALKKDSLLLPVYTNLATAYRMNGNTEAAFKTLNTLIKKIQTMAEDIS